MCIRDRSYSVPDGNVRSETRCEWDYTLVYRRGATYQFVVEQVEPGSHGLGWKRQRDHRLVFIHLHRVQCLGTACRWSLRLLGKTRPDSLRSQGCCLLYTSDAADERSSVDLGGRRII